MRAVAPPALSKPLPVGASPTLGEPRVGERLAQHEVRVLQDLHFDRYEMRIQHAPDVASPAAEAPQDPRSRIRRICAHAVGRPFEATDTELLL